MDSIYGLRRWVYPGFSTHPNNFSSHGFLSVSLRSSFFEPNQFLALDLSQKAKKGSKRLLGKTFVPHPNMSRPVTLTVSHCRPCLQDSAVLRFSLVWFVPLNHDMRVFFSHSDPRDMTGFSPQVNMLSQKCTSTAKTVARIRPLLAETYSPTPPERPSLAFP